MKTTTKATNNDDVGESNTLPEESDVVLQLAQKLCLLRVPRMAGMSGAGVKGEGGESGAVNGPRVSLASVQEELLGLGMAKKYVAVCEEFEQMASKAIAARKEASAQERLPLVTRLKTLLGTATRDELQEALVALSGERCELIHRLSAPGGQPA